MPHSPFNSAQERNRTLADFWHTLRDNPAALFCFCCYALWMIIVFQSSALLPSGSFSGMTVPGWILPMACMALASFLIAVVFWIKRFIIPTRPLLITMTLFMTTGALCFALCIQNIDSLGPESSRVFFFAGSLLAGTGTAFLYVEMNRILGHLGMRKTGFLAIAALIVASCLAPALSFAPSDFKILPLVVLPFVTVLLYAQAIKSFNKEEYFSHGIQTPLYFPWKYLMTSFLQGISLGTVGASIIFLPGNDLDIIPNVVGCIVACVMFLGTITFLKLDFNRLIYQIGFPLMALGFYLIGLLVPHAGIGGFIQITGYYFVDLSMWCLGSYLIKNRGLPATWIAMGPSCSLFVGNMVGGLFGWLSSKNLPVEGMGAIMNGAALLLLASALFLSNENNFRFGWGTLRPVSHEDEIDWFKQVCAYLESEYDLTGRQADVLRLLATDRSRKQIAEELYISEDTVKTHVRNLYQKLSVHSQKELAEFVRATSIMLKIEVAQPHERGLPH